jgi:hypothetical protein
MGKYSQIVKEWSRCHHFFILNTIYRHIIFVHFSGISIHVQIRRVPAWNIVFGWLGKTYLTGVDGWNHFNLFGNLLRFKDGGRVHYKKNEELRHIDRGSLVTTVAAIFDLGLATF